jgi:dTDP-4-dehydrorhamnose 3,5-epimerase
MNFLPCPVSGAFVVVSQATEDDRGSFVRTYCQDEFVRRGLCADIAQCSVSYNRRKGTLRGLHLQIEPHQECKLVRCARGAIYDVLVDLRRASPTYGTWHAVELTARDGAALYIPAGCAHGFQTLQDDTEVHYQISAAYMPEQARGLRWDDRTLNIPWPLSVTSIAARDAAFPDWDSWHRNAS